MFSSPFCAKTFKRICYALLAPRIRMGPRSKNENPTPTIDTSPMRRSLIPAQGCCAYTPGHPGSKATLQNNMSHCGKEVL
eukprot:3794351-Amphidinium_carterae.1